MSRIARRSAGGAVKTGEPRGRQDATSPLASWIAPQLCQPVGTAPSGPQWLHEIKLDGFRMSARIERGRVQLLTRTGLDWSDKYPNVVAASRRCGRKPLTSTANYAALAMTDCLVFRRRRPRATASAE